MAPTARIPSSVSRVPATQAALVGDRLQRHDGLLQCDRGGCALARAAVPARQEVNAARGAHLEHLVLECDRQSTTRA